MPAPAPSSHDYGVNSYGATPQPSSEMHSLQNNYGEQDTVTDAYQQQSQGVHYDDQQQHQYHSNYYQAGPSDHQPYADQQSQVYQPQSIDSNNALSYGDTNYLNSEVISRFIHFHLHLQSIIWYALASIDLQRLRRTHMQCHASTSETFAILPITRAGLICTNKPTFMHRLDTYDFRLFSLLVCDFQFRIVWPNAILLL